MEPRNTLNTRKLNHLWNERRDWRWELGTGAGKIRRPKSEIRKMTEIRSPNGSHHEPGFELRPSDLLRISAFGFRIFHAMPFKGNQPLLFRVVRVFRGLNSRL